MLIYKYTPYRSAKLIVENGSMRFTQPEALNDPFELNPSLDRFRLSIKNYVRSLPLFIEQTKGLGLVQKGAKADEIVKDSIEEVKAHIRRSLVLSLTKKPDNVLMRRDIRVRSRVYSISAQPPYRGLGLDGRPSFTTVCSGVDSSRLGHAIDQTLDHKAVPRALLEGS